MEPLFYNLCEIVDYDSSPELIIFTQERFKNFLDALSSITEKAIVFSPAWPMYAHKQIHKIIVANSLVQARAVENEVFKKMMQAEKTNC